MKHSSLNDLMLQDKIWNQEAATKACWQYWLSNQEYLEVKQLGLDEFLQIFKPTKNYHPKLETIFILSKPLGLYRQNKLYKIISGGVVHTVINYKLYLKLK